MDLFLLGATAAASAVAGLLFLRMWRESRDRLYVMFACSFWLEALARIALILTDHPSEAHPARYLLRVAAYGLILIAIADKNVRRR
jgi:hypothetical protein